MILPDVNVLLYAYDKDSRFHSSAAAWLETALSEEQVALTWHTITAFIRIFTHPSIMHAPVTVEQAVDIVGTWVQLENVHLISLEKRNWAAFADVLVESRATGNLVMDAHLAAMAMSSGARLATTDRDFRRFSGIRLIDPINK